MNPSQCRAARALLGLSQRQLASGASLGESSVRDFEAERRIPSHPVLVTIRTTLEAAGAVFIDADENGGPGVRLKIKQ